MALNQVLYGTLMSAGRPRDSSTESPLQLSLLLLYTGELMLQLLDLSNQLVVAQLGFNGGALSVLTVEVLVVTIVQVLWLL